MTNAEAPEHFLCPISMVVMSHPVRTNTGHVFERQAIMEWIYFGKGTCPMSRKPLHPSTITRDVALERDIQKWRLEKKSIPAEGSDHDESHSSVCEDRPVPITQAQLETMTRLTNLRKKVFQIRDRRLASLGEQRWSYPETRIA